jgi:hypothetical protein
LKIIINEYNKKFTLLRDIWVMYYKIFLML